MYNINRNFLKGGELVYKEQLESIDELKRRGYQIEPNGILIHNRLKETLEKKDMTIINLSEKTGISRQTLHNIINETYSPGIEMVLKIANVLNTPVEEIFQLKDEAWFSRVKKVGERNLYVDVISRVVVDKEAMLFDIEKNGFYYYDIITKRKVSEEELEKWRTDQYDAIYENSSEWPRIFSDYTENGKIDKRIIRRLIKERVKKMEENRFIPKYQKLVRRISR